MKTMIKKVGLSVAVCVALSGNAYSVSSVNPVAITQIVVDGSQGINSAKKEESAKLTSSAFNIASSAIELSNKIKNKTNYINDKIVRHGKLLESAKIRKETLLKSNNLLSADTIKKINTNGANIVKNTNAINKLSSTLIKETPSYVKYIGKVGKVMGDIGIGIGAAADIYQFSTSQKEAIDYANLVKNGVVTGMSFVPIGGTMVAATDLTVTIVSDKVDSSLDLGRDATLSQVNLYFAYIDELNVKIDKRMNDAAQNEQKLSSEDIIKIVRTESDSISKKIKLEKPVNFNFDGNAAIAAQESALALVSAIRNPNSQTALNYLKKYEIKVELNKLNKETEAISKLEQEIQVSSIELSDIINQAEIITVKAQAIAVDYDNISKNTTTQPTTPIVKNEKKEDDKKAEKDDGVYDKKIGGETHNSNDYKSVNQNSKTALEQFIIANQDNPMYAEEIKLAKNRINAIDTEYQKFANAKTKQELKSYTNNYPNGIWKTEANYKIADIDLKSLGSNPTQKQIDAYKSLYSDPSYGDYTRKAESYRAEAIKTEFTQLKNGGKATQADYIRFVEAHKGDSNYAKVITKANYEIAWIDLKAIEANPTKEKIDAFLSKYSDSSYADYRGQVSALLGNAEAIAKSKQNNADRIMSWNKATSQNTIESYAEYLLHYPNSTNAQEAYDNLAGLYGKNPELVSWEPPMVKGKTAYDISTYLNLISFIMTVEMVF